MGGLNRYLIICPLADVAGVAGAVPGITPTSPLYTEVDTPPRTQTHAYTATAFTALQEAAILAVKPSFPNSVFEIYNAKTQGTYPQLRVAELGLTVSDGTGP